MAQDRTELPLYQSQINNQTVDVLENVNVTWKGYTAIIKSPRGNFQWDFDDMNAELILLANKKGKASGW